MALVPQVYLQQVLEILDGPFALTRETVDTFLSVLRPLLARHDLLNAVTRARAGFAVVESLKRATDRFTPEAFLGLARASLH